MISNSNKTKVYNIVITNSQIFSRKEAKKYSYVRASVCDQPQLICSKYPKML